MTATLLTVFPSVHTIDVPGSLNTILVATLQDTEAETLQSNLTALPESAPRLLRSALETATENLRPTVAGPTVFTDERAPVETIVDSLVLRYLLREGPTGLPGLEG